jgi:endo-1,4-beta-xylanase
MAGAQEATPLRELAAEHGLYIGAALNTDAFRNNDAYMEIFEREFNVITPENMFKFGPLSTGRGRYFWHDTDAMVDWAEANDMRIHGHTLVWHNQQPDWLNEDRLTPAEIEAVLEEHIKTTVGRYKGRIHEWDVVNEGIDDNGGLRDTIWLRAIGPDYIAKAFRWAHEADPDALLFYNDYNADVPNRKSREIFELVEGLVNDGVPIHGVGLQMHLIHQQRQAASTEAVREVMDRLDTLGLKVAVTEMDVRIHHATRSREDMLDLQAEMYANVMRACLEAPNCDTFVAWGLSDNYSWIPGFTGNEDWPLLFDAALEPKPAYYAVADVLAKTGE